MRTPVYVKMNAKDQLLLLEGVGRQLSIISVGVDPSSTVMVSPNVCVPVMQARLIHSEP